MGCFYIKKKKRSCLTQKEPSTTTKPVTASSPEVDLMPSELAPGLKESRFGANEAISDEGGVSLAQIDENRALGPPPSDTVEMSTTNDDGNGTKRAVNYCWLRAFKNLVI